MTATQIDRVVNPAFAGNQAPRYARLPQAPVTASPVPRLTSLYHFAATGDFGDRGYPGNCGGFLIRDLLLYFRPARVFDPMSGSGTCREVCAELEIACDSGDIHQGFDACNPTRMPHEKFDFVWTHPPYWRQKLYAADARDLSRAPTLGAFLNRYAAFLRNCGNVLAPGGKLAVLIGDYADREVGFVPLTYHDLVPRLCENLGDPAAHGARADDDDGFACCHSMAPPIRTQSASGRATPRRGVRTWSFCATPSGRAASSEPEAQATGLNRFGVPCRPRARAWGSDATALLHVTPPLVGGEVPRGVSDTLGSSKTIFRDSLTPAMK